MEHEVFVPFPVDTVRRALSDPARIARSIPGLQQDADPAADRTAPHDAEQAAVLAGGHDIGPIVGRLRLRVGGHTITYRGTLRITERAGTFEAEAEGTEVRGEGTVKLALTLTPTTEAGGTRLHCSGTVRSEGRLAEFEPEVTDPVARRLLDRFGAALSSGLEQAEAAEVPPQQPPAESGAQGTGGVEGAPGGEGLMEHADAAEDAVQDGGEGPAQHPESDGAPEAGESGGNGADGGDGEAAGGGPRTPSVFETEVPPPSLDPRSDDLEAAKGPEGSEGIDGSGMGGGGIDGVDPLDIGDEPPAEAAHARRTMIGRSTEEVDHAPPRGRYAPVPVPEAAPAAAALRWAAPAAAVVLASAVVVGRRLARRRR
ncbi:hypothetical protein [Streptomyces palmae]|uniref:Carbon monoxide dehydrogenase subunit G n=1 Tax=Streptomyces palmae TaxID=1701085 RepID=A0A4Z0H7F9_9ACTN|nr:hypothetical protein [Streptomyces palmae]TGB06373.1 hypothetical protein E4099_18315 [Streptomyces palmae]